MSTAVTPSHDTYTHADADADALELVQKANSLREQLTSNAAVADSNRELAKDDVAAMTELGLTSLTTPKRFGGSETSVSTLVEVVSALGRGDMSAGWIAGVSNAAAFVVALFSEQAQAEVWGKNPKVRCAGVLAPTGQSTPAAGGIRLTGKWPYMSGVTFADWVFVTAPLNGSLGPGAEVGFVLLPREDIEVEDSWFVTGMRGTASNTAVLHDVFIPEHRIMRFADYDPNRFEGLYRSSIFSMLNIGLVSTMMGEAESALDLVIVKAEKRSIATTNYRTQTSSAAFQVQLGTAASIVNSARLSLRRLAEDLDAQTQSEVTASDADMAKARSDSGWIASECWRAVDMLASAHGTSSFAMVNPLERMWRNTAVASRHAGLSARVGHEFYGRALLGLTAGEIGTLL